MTTLRARTLFCLVLVALSLGLLGNAPETRPALRSRTNARNTVYVGTGLTPEQLIVLGSTVAAGDPEGLLLLGTPDSANANRAFLAELKPSEVVSVGPAVEESVQEAHDWRTGPPLGLWRDLFPKAPVVVVCPPEPRAQLLQAACLAGALKAPLFVTRDRPHELRQFKALLDGWQTRKVVAVGSAYPPADRRPGLDVSRLIDEKAVAAAHLDELRKSGPVTTLVIANPEDTKADKPGTSCLAPWIALRKRAALLLTSKAGDDVETVVNQATRHPALARADTVILAANLEAIPMHEWPNPIPADKDKTIELEPLTPAGREPYSFSVGRVFHKDLGVAALMLARSRLMERPLAAPRALVASNPGASLPLLETFSRTTARELRNCGYDTTTLLGKSFDGDDMRQAFGKHDILLWEGHHGTLIKEWKFPEWEERSPSLVFLQSCLALMEYKVEHLFERGAVWVIGTMSRTYSGSGGAYSLAFFDSALYEQRNLGDSLRHGKNFLQAYSLLKDKRLGNDARRTGANLRAAWSFTLWGDPTLSLPRPRKQPEVPPVLPRIENGTITVALPEDPGASVRSDKYRARVAPNVRLAGLLRGDEDDKSLVPLVFAEVSLTDGPEGMTPRLKTKLPARNWVFNWDARRRCGYLLAVPRDSDRTLRFRVEWVPTQSLEVPVGLIGD